MRDEDRSARIYRRLLPGVFALVVLVVGAALLLVGPEQTWEEKFNEEIGPSNSVNIVGFDAPARLSFDFVPDDEPDHYSGTICWAPKSDTQRLEGDAWANFSDAIRRYSGIKLTFDDGGTRDGVELAAVNLTVDIPVVRERNPDAAMRHARRTIDILHRESPCVTR